MKKQKKITAAIAAILTLLLALTAMAGCEKKEDGETITNTPIEGLISIQPMYVGEPVTDTQHEFKKSDFQVIGAFKNNVSLVVTDFQYEIKEMAGGHYIITFYYGGQDNELYVPIEMNFFPTDRDSYKN